MNDRLARITTGLMLIIISMALSSLSEWLPEPANLIALINSLMVVLLALFIVLTGKK